MSKQSHTRTQITDLPESSAELSEDDLALVVGGAFWAGTRAVGQAALNARGTKERTNTNDNGSHDYDSEWDYTTL